MNCAQKLDVNVPDGKENNVAPKAQENLDGQSSPGETCVVDGVEITAKTRRATGDDSDLDGMSFGNVIEPPPPEPPKQKWTPKRRSRRADQEG